MKNVHLGIPLFIVAVIILVRCGAGGGGAREPNAQDFSSPTGSFTNSNINGLTQNFFETIRIGTAFFANNTDSATTNCFTINSDGTSGEIDVNCLVNAGVMVGSLPTGCSGSGNVTYSSKTSNGSLPEDAGFDGLLMETTFEETSATVNCPGKEWTCNGEFKLLDKVEFPSHISNSWILCENATCTINGAAHTYEFCDYNLDGLFSFYADDENVLFLSGGFWANDDCSQISVPGKDASGNATITCDVSPASSGCLNIDATVSNCTISR
ncbi:MAG: hypothetical protein V1798_07340 [Pseudomonadota bacterium]